MYKLKQFGAMASSWLKKRKPLQKRGTRTLKGTLFVQPLAIIFLSLGLILLIFNLSLRAFINGEVNTAVQHRYDQLRAQYRQRRGFHHLTFSITGAGARPELDGGAIAFIGVQ